MSEVITVGGQIKENETCAWTLYKFATINEYVTIRCYSKCVRCSLCNFNRLKNYE